MRCMTCSSVAICLALCGTLLSSVPFTPLPLCLLPSSLLLSAPFTPLPLCALCPLPSSPLPLCAHTCKPALLSPSQGHVLGLAALREPRAARGKGEGTGDPGLQLVSNPGHASPGCGTSSCAAVWPASTGVIVPTCSVCLSVCVSVCVCPWVAHVHQVDDCHDVVGVITRADLTGHRISHVARKVRSGRSAGVRASFRQSFRFLI